MLLLYMLIIALWTWAVFNFIIGIYEIYCFINRNKLRIGFYAERPVIGSWSEYCRVDSRYIYKPYVWGFELLNAALATVFLYVMMTSQSITLLTYILTLQVIACSIYFITLYKDKETLVKAEETKVTLYYGISSVWIIAPLILLVGLILKL